MPLEGGPSRPASPTSRCALGGTTLPVPGERFEGARLAGLEKAARAATLQDAEKQASERGLTAGKKEYDIPAHIA